jgi:hypothetical protein
MLASAQLDIPILLRVAIASDDEKQWTTTTCQAYTNRSNIR